VGEYRFGIAQSRYRKNYERIFEAVVARSTMPLLSRNTHFDRVRFLDRRGW
jgi:hypothetical protein